MKYQIKKFLKKIGLYDVFCRIFLSKRKFIIEPFVYIDKNGNIKKDEITDTIRWLEKFEVKSKCIEFAEIEFKKYAKKKYDFYEAIWLF